MKGLNSIKLTICVCLLMAANTACEKFSILKSEDSESIAAGSNLKNKTIWEFLAENDFHANDLTNIGYYGRAVEHAGLKDLLNGEGNFTVIIPTETTLRAFITDRGYNSLEDVPPVILKNFLLNSIIDKRIHSFDLPIANPASFGTLSDDSLYLSRTASTSNEYIFTVNSASDIVAPSARVRSQNLEFMNGVAHVVDIFTYYNPKLSSPDPIVDANVQVLSDTVFVTKDSYMNNGNATNKNKNFGTEVGLLTKRNTDGNLTRRAITQFVVRAPSFTERIGTVKVGLYVTRIDGNGTVSLYEDQYIDWNEYTINWNNAPVPGTVSLADINLATGGANKWYTGDITSAYTSAMSQNKDFINIGINTASSPLFTIASREVPNRRPYVVINSSPVSILVDPVNTGLVVDSKLGSKKITMSELKFSGTTNKNIFYTLTTLPASGYITINSFPAIIGSVFSQEQIEKGIVKYLYAGPATTDSFSLEAKDFQGGYYQDPLTVNIQIQ